MKYLHTFLLAIIVILTAFLLHKSPVSITTNQCPASVEKPADEYKMDDWVCEKAGSSSDLLQPSGLWLNQHLTVGSWK